MTSLLFAAVLSGSFVLDATPVEAFEGGPVTVDLSFRWVGPGATHLWRGGSPISGMSLHFPPGMPHLRRPEPLTLWGGVHLFGGEVLDKPPPPIEPGAVFTKRIHLNVDYFAAYEAGDLPLVVRCWIPIPQKPSGLYVEKTVVIRLAPYARTHADALYAEISQELKSRPVTDWDRKCVRVQNRWTPVVQRIIHTRHPELAPAAFLLLVHRPGGAWEGELKDFLYRVCSRARVHDMLLSLLEEKRRDGVGWVFEDWRRSRSRIELLPGAVVRSATNLEWTHVGFLTRDWNRLATGWAYPAGILEEACRHLSDGQLTRLATNTDELVGAWTYAVFADRLPAKRGDEIVARLRARYSAMPETEFRRLVVDLDDDDFQTREAATAALIENFDRVNGDLIAASRAATSPEVVRRLGTVAVAGRLRPRAMREIELLAELREHQTTAHRRLLTAISDGRPGISMVDEAKRILLATTAKP